MRRVFLASSNPGKLLDFTAAAAATGVEVAPLPGFDVLPSVTEDGETFAVNARRKAEHYSSLAPGKVVLADDSGLEVDALGGAPGARSARYAADDPASVQPGLSTDAANNRRLLRRLSGTPAEQRAARFVCVIAAACDGKVLAEFGGTAEGVILNREQGSGGFGYDPLFYYPPLQKTFAELTPGQKAAVSHRCRAFRAFLEWYKSADVKF